MLTGITGMILTPGNLGKNYLGNGTHADFECCCDECNYALCCSDNHDPTSCIACSEKDCPRSAGSG